MSLLRRIERGGQGQEKSDQYRLNPDDFIKKYNPPYPYPYPCLYPKRRITISCINLIKVNSPERKQ